MPSKFQPPPAAVIVLANLVALVAVFQPASAADESRWDGDQRGAVRLIAAAQRGEGPATIHRAGVEIRLAPGWKTYWRYPGDSGIPPRFDFTRSRNLKSVTIRYPAPHRLADEGGTSIGYKNGVVFPLDIVPQDAAQPVALSVAVEYAVCEKICVPAEGTAELTLTGRPGSQDGWLAQNEALVPAPASLGDRSALAIRTVRREDKRIIVDIAAPAGSLELFAEGPTPDWALPVPAPIEGAPAGLKRFALELDGLPPNTQPDGAVLRLTAVAGEQAIEVPFRLD
jgi:DsbC/DsbD-like thiol-disulfide interchange protein